MLKILVIEDEKSIRDDIRDILVGCGFDCIGAEDGLVGLRLAIDYQPDLIICDIAMPNLDGFGVLRALRSSSQFGATPFIFMTAKTDRASQRLGMNLGADDFIIKPISQDDLLEAIAARWRKNRVEALQNQSQKTNEELLLSLKNAETKLNYLIQNDSLTGLLNRHTFKEKLKSCAAKGSLAILLINLDRFNRINKFKGYIFADKLLQLVSERLQQSVYIGQSLARIDADEFALILQGDEFENNLQSAAETLAQNILNSFSHSFVVDSQELRISASIGIALFPNHGQNLDILLQSVNAALRYAKTSSGNSYWLFSADIQEPEDSLELEIELYKAIDRNQLTLHYQPQICLTSKKINGVEALLRWHHPKFGAVPWYKFIPLAERNGAIIPIGEWVVRTACKQMKAWHNLQKNQLQKNQLQNNQPQNNRTQNNFPDSEVARPTKVSVNLSARQFQQSNLVEMVSNILDETQLNPVCLDLELTESAIVQDIEGSIIRLNYLKTLGIEISLDDFGTGYSSLSYLQQFPLNTLKIDQGFIRNMSISSKNKAIAVAMIQLGHSMNLKVLAEGVETKAELDILLEHRCDLIQGYLFSKALPAPECERLLLQDRRLVA